MWFLHNRQKSNVSCTSVIILKSRLLITMLGDFGKLQQVSSSDYLVPSSYSLVDYWELVGV